MYRAAGPPNPFGSPVQSKEVEMTMKTLRMGVTAVVASLALGLPAEAQLLPTITPSCDNAITGGAFGGST